MKIGLLFDCLTIPPKDGVTYRFYNVARYLAKQNADLLVYLGDRGWIKDSDLKKEPFSSILFPANWLYDENIIKVAALIKKDNINVLHICNSHPVILNYGRRLAGMLKVPLICDMHDVDHVLFKSLKMSESEIELSRETQRVVAACSNQVICMSSLDYQQLLELGISSKKLRYIPNGVDAQEYKKRKCGSFHVVFVGNLHYQPNFNAAKSIIKNIAPKVWEKYPQARFTIIGRKRMVLMKFQIVELN
jgi:glycosyltransferase involved in cell wall biosynthesis